MHAHLHPLLTHAPLLTPSDHLSLNARARAQTRKHTCRYEGSRFDYLTIRGSGHMVPEFKPAAAYEMLRAWLKDEDYQPYVASCQKPH